MTSGFDIRVLNVRPAGDGSGPVRAYVDVELENGVGKIRVFGCSAIHQDGKPAWVGFPKKPGKTKGKYFPVVELEGKVRELVVAAILDAVHEAQLI